MVAAGELDPGKLDSFLRLAFGDAKADFLGRHGDWLHRGGQNRLAVAIAGEVAAYCAVIPARLLVLGEETEAVWWVDLYIPPEYRGRGLQRLFDQRIRDLAGLKVGFGNRLAAGIHRRHGWSVREDLRASLAPLRSAGLRFLGGGPRRLVGAAILAPVAAVLRTRLARFRPRTARLTEGIPIAELAGVFDRGHRRGVASTLRDREYLSWRYDDAPYRSDLRAYLAGPAELPSLALIARWVRTTTGLTVRVLDFFGDLEDRSAVAELLQLVLRDASVGGASQVTALTSLPQLRRCLKRAGFWIATPARLCWHSHQPVIMARLGESPQHWVLGDSDNDEPALAAGRPESSEVSD